MPSQQIPLIMEIIDNIVSPDDRKRKYTDRQILKVLIVLQLFNISYRSARIFLTSHEKYLRMIGIKEIPSFQTLSRRARMIGLLMAQYQYVGFIDADGSLAPHDFKKMLQLIQDHCCVISSRYVSESKWIFMIIYLRTHMQFQ